jgi:hypothetical protein
VTTSITPRDRSARPRANTPTELQDLP